LQRCQDGSQPAPWPTPPISCELTRSQLSCRVHSPQFAGVPLRGVWPSRPPSSCPDEIQSLCRWGRVCCSRCQALPLPVDCSYRRSLGALLAVVDSYLNSLRSCISVFSKPNSASSIVAEKICVGGRNSLS